jgi:hypothetical protein
MNSCVLAHFTNNKRYFKSYRPINNYTVSIVTSDIFSIKGIEIIQMEVFILPEKIKIRFQINNIYYSSQIRMSLLSPIKLFRQLEVTYIEKHRYPIDAK